MFAMNSVRFELVYLNHCAILFNEYTIIFVFMIISLFNCKCKCVHIICSIGSPEPKITWKKGDKEIKPKKKDKRFVISWDIDNDLNTLEIKDAKVEDSGVYTIEATNSLGTVQSTVTVTVQPTEEPEAINEAVCVEETAVQETAAEQENKTDKVEEAADVIEPEILIKPEDVQVIPGATVKLSCKIKG